MLALIGDIFGSFGKTFPINTTRFKNLTTTNPVPLEPIYDLLGSPPYSLEEGVAETVSWLQTQGDFWN